MSVLADHFSSTELVHALLSMGYRRRPSFAKKECFMKPIGHGCFIFHGSKIEMVFEDINLAIISWGSVQIKLNSEIPLLRQIAIAESSLLSGAKFDRNGVTFAFLSAKESSRAML